MTTTNRPIVPEDRARPGQPLQPLIRAAAALLASTVDGHQTAADYLAHNFPRDQEAQLRLKAAVNPAAMTSPTAFGMTKIADIVRGLGPASAMMAVFDRGLTFQFDHAAGILVPNLLSAAGNASFVQEGSPIPVRQFSLDTVTLAPRKLAVLSVFNREIFQHSVPTIESLVGDAITRSAALAVDAAALDTVAGDATRPSGLRNGIAAAGTASTATPPPAAMAADVATLVGSVAAISGNNPVALVCAPPQAAALRLWQRGDSGFEVFSTSGLSNGTVCAVAVDGLCSAMGQPRLEIGGEATLAMDTSPLPISTVGTPNTIAPGVRSLWQADAISLRMIFDVSWALRSASALAWLQSVNW